MRFPVPDVVKHSGFPFTAAFRTGPDVHFVKLSVTQSSREPFITAGIILERVEHLHLDFALAVLPDTFERNREPCQ